MAEEKINTKLMRIVVNRFKANKAIDDMYADAVSELFMKSRNLQEMSMTRIHFLQVAQEKYIASGEMDLDQAKQALMQSVYMAAFADVIVLTMTGKLRIEHVEKGGPSAGESNN